MSMELTVRRLINLVTKDLTKMQDFWQERTYDLSDSTNFDHFLNLEKDVKIFSQKIQTLLDFWQRLKSLEDDDAEEIVAKKTVKTVNCESQTEDPGSESPPLSLDSLHNEEASSEHNFEVNQRSEMQENFNDNDPQESEVEILQSPIFGSSVNHNALRNDVANNENSDLDNEQDNEIEEIQDIPSPAKSPSSSIDPSDDLVDYEVKIEEDVQDSTNGTVTQI